MPNSCLSNLKIRYFRTLQQAGGAFARKFRYMQKMQKQLNMSENSKKISICALLPDPYDTTPSQRFRIEQWEPFLKQKNITIDYYSFSDQKLREVIYEKGHVTAKAIQLLKANLRRTRQVLKARNYDVVFLHRAASMIGPAWLEKYLKWSGVPIIFDFDDAIFLTHTHEANKLFSWAKFSWKTASICRLSNAVTVGNAWLADYARKQNPNVTIIPSSVDTNIYQPAAKKPKEKIVVGWTGSSTSQTHLEMFAALLKEMTEKFSVEIHVHSNRSPDLPDIPVVWHQWSPENEVEVISSFDIGIMPMPDDEWSLGKCSMKVLLYMSLGVPTVCADIGMNREVIQHGENGFLAKTSDDWLKAIEKLVNDAELRKRIGEKSRQTVVEHYSMEKCAGLFAEVVEKTLRK